MRLLFSKIFSFLLCCCFQIEFLAANQRGWNSQNPTVFNIGGVLSSNESEKHFKDTIDVSKIIIKKYIQLGIIIIIYSFVKSFIFAEFSVNTE